MAALFKFIVFTLVTITIVQTASIASSEEKSSTEDIETPRKLIKPQFPKKYQEISLKKYRPLEKGDNELIEETTTDTSATTVETIEENTDLVPTEEETETEDGANRSKKSAITTFCVEIRPKNPYKQAFQVCEPVKVSPNAYPVPEYGQKIQHTPQVIYRPIKAQPAQPAQYPAQAPHYPAQAPYYPAQAPHYAAPAVHYPAPAPVKVQPVYEEPVQSYDYPAAEQVPVAKPIHLAPAAAKYPPQHNSGYRASNPWDNQWDQQWEVDEAGNGPMAGRSAYLDPYGSYEHAKTPIYDFHKKKEISYLPIMTKSITKTSPLKLLKVLKDLKKDKIKIMYDEDDYDYRPQYAPHHAVHESSYEPHHPVHESSYEPQYGRHESNGYGSAPHSGSNAHGLVITCQPSAVGYTGDHHTELAKHMDLLKHIYAESEKLYSDVPKTESSYGSPPIHHSSEPSSGSSGYVPPPIYRTANAEMPVASEGLRNAETQSNWDENVASTRGSSADPMMVDPTASISQPTQKDIDTQNAFRNSRKYSGHAQHNQYQGPSSSHQKKGPPSSY